MKRLLISVLFSQVVLIAVAQQDPQFSHNMFNNMGINPAYAGVGGDINITAINRQQWVGFDDAPNTTLLSVDRAFTIKGIPSGLGLTLVDDRIGFNTDFNLKLAYSYHKKVKFGNLSFGIELGFINKGLSADWVWPEQTESNISTEDSKMAFDLGLGAFYKKKDLYLGLSLTHLNQARINYDDATTYPYMQRHIYLAGGYKFALPYPLLELSPSFLVKSDASATQVSVNANVTYNKRFWGGVTYRNLDAIIILAGLELKNGIKFGYAYDITTTKIRYGSHELMLNYSFNMRIGKSPEKYKSVRFL